MKNIINKNRKFTKTLAQAEQLFKLKTGRNYNDGKPGAFLIFELKEKRTPTRRFFVGTENEWLNL